MSSHNIVKLNGENFFEWKFVLEGFFLEEGLDITKKIQEEKLNGKALRLIRQYSGPEVIPHIEGIVDANAAWTVLGTRYGQVSVETRFVNLQSLLSIKKYEEESFSMYTARAWQLFNKVNSVYYAVQVKVENEVKIENNNPFIISELVFVALVINGLPPENKLAVSRRLVLKPDLKFSDLDAVIGAVQREGTKEEPILVANTEPGRKPPKKCHYCGKLGHIRKHCFKLKKKEVNVVEVSVSEIKCSLDSYWLLDSCAGAHVVGNVNLFEKGTLRTISDCCIRFANGKRLDATHVGTVLVRLRGMIVKLEDTLLVPDCKKMIISLGLLTKVGWRIEIGKDKCIMSLNGQEIHGVRRDNIYVITNEQLIEECNYISASVIHRRLAHPGENAMKSMGYPTDKEFCEPCILAEHPAKPVKRRSKPTVKSLVPLERIYMDLMGPFPETFGGAKYVFSLLDEYSRYSFVYLMKLKSQTFDCFVMFKALVENQLSKKIKQIKCDKGGEFSSVKFKNLCEKDGICMKFAPTEKKESVSLIERLNRTLQVKMRALIHGGNHSLRLWGEAMITANFIRNRTYCSTIKCYPCERWDGTKPSHDNLRVWVARHTCVSYLEIDQNSINNRNHSCS